MNVTRMVAIVGTLVALAMPARAEPGPIGQWLMNEPVTLWDRGMVRADDAAKRASQSIFEVPDEDMSTGLAWYEWDNNQIVIASYFYHWGGPLTYDECNALRRAFIHHMIGVSITSEHFETAMHGTIKAWFSHEGFQRGNRDEDLEKKLARIIHVRTSIFRTDMDDGVICTARLMEADAPSKPYP